MDEYCPVCGLGLECCPICGSKLVVLEYRGNEPHVLAMMKRRDFRGFLGCNRADLHDKVVDGVNYQDKAFIKAIFHSRKKK
jgi:hypothetical protein